MEQDYKERAARAELAAERLAAVLQHIYLNLCLEGTDSPNGKEARAALDQWAAHQADYDTLDAADSDPDPAA